MHIQHRTVVMNERVPRAISLVALGLLLSLAACQGSPDDTEPDTADSAAPVSAAAAAAPSSATLPGNVEDGNCTDADRPAAPDACAWAASTDAVVWGVLREIKLVESPAIAAWNVSGKWQWAADCDAVNPALELIVDVQRVLSGDRSLVGKLSVKIGTRQREQLDPMPVLDAHGALAWEKIGTSKGGPLAVGQTIGLPLHYIPEYQIWSLMGESPFALDAVGRIAFQDRRGQCSEPAPVAMTGLALDPLGRTLASCGTASAAGNARRARVRQLWGAAQDPTAFMAAACFKKQAAPRPGECAVASDCINGQECVAGTCRGS